MDNVPERLEYEDFAALDEFLWGRRIGSDQMDQLVLRLSNESKILRDFEDQLNRLIEARGRQNAELDFWLGTTDTKGAAHTPEPPEYNILTGEALTTRIVVMGGEARRTRRGKMDVVEIFVADESWRTVAVEEWILQEGDPESLSETVWKLEDVRRVR